MIEKFILWNLARAVVATLRNYKVLTASFGQYRTMRLKECVDADGNPIPWYTYPATEYIGQLDFSDKLVFEFGSGNSTRFWAKRAKKVFSVEDNSAWFDKMKGRLPDTVEYRLCVDPTEYIESIGTHQGEFDVVIIDGSRRYQCAIEALRKLRSDGFIILDNSDWHAKTSALLRDSGLLEVDMSGFGPVNGYTWTTSFYFTRAVRLTPVHNRQPVHGIGSLHHSDV